METRTTEPVMSLAAAPSPEPLHLVPTTGETAAIVGHLPPARRRIGTTELRVFPLAMSGKRFGASIDAAAAVEVLDAYDALGGNLIDTADSYAGGSSETIVGEWMRRRGNRDEMVVATKIGKSGAHPGLGAPAITAAVESSLRRLGTDRIDLLYLHIDDPEVAFDETLLAVDELIRSGKVRHFGGSDHTGNRLIEARVACAMLGVAPMVALQNQYSLMHRREYEGDLARVAAQQGLAVMPRFPLAGGFLSGDYRSRAQVAAAPWPTHLTPHLGRRGRRVLAALDKIAILHDAAVSTIALAWLQSKPHVVAPVVSAATAEQLFDVMSSVDVHLTRQQLAELDRASA